MPITIRPAVEADLPDLLSLIRAIAEFEHLSHQVTATEETLQASLFGPEPAARVLLAEAEGQTVAYAVYFFSFSTFVGKRSLWMEDLFVLPDFRGRGIARELLRDLARIAVRADCGRFEWMVLEWNTRAQRFYESLGARPLNDWRVYRMTGDAVSALTEEGSESPPA